MSIAYAALWCFVFSLPWENVIVIPGVGAISRLMGMLALGIVVITTLISGRLRRWHAFHIATLLFVMWAGCVFLALSTSPLIPNKFKTYVQLLLLMWMIWELAYTRRRVLGLLLSYVLGAYVAIGNTIMVFRTQSGVLRRFAAEGFDPNDLAMTLALALPIAWYLGVTYRHPLLRWICRGYIPVGLVAIGLTGSRGGMVASIVALMVVPLTMTRLSPGKLAAAMLLLSLSGGLAITYVPRTLMARLASTSTAVEDGSLGGRTRIWKAGVEAFVQRPITGFGPGQFQPAILPILGYTRVSHNSYLTVLVEQGIVGFLLYAMMFGAVFLAVLNLPTLDRRFALVLLATVVVAMLPLAWEDRKPAWFMLAALLGLAQAPGASMAWAKGYASLRPRQPAPVPGPPTSSPAREPLTARVRNRDWDPST